MSLPVSPEYLAVVLAKERVLADMTVRQHQITDLRLPTGKLVATDAFVFPEAQPFELPLPCGVFPVILSVAHFSDDQRVQFAAVKALYRLHRQVQTALGPARYFGAVTAFGTFEEIGAAHATIRGGSFGSPPERRLRTPALTLYQPPQCRTQIKSVEPTVRGSRFRPSQALDRPT